MLHHKYEVTIRFTTDRPLTEHERNCLMSYTVAQVDEPAIHDNDGNIQDADFRTWVADVDLNWTGFIRRVRPGSSVEVTPTCDVCAQPCDEEQREWCGTCGNCADHCATEMDCAGVTA